MSGFFGIFNRNGKAVEKDIVDDMLEAMSYWGPDEKDVWIGGPVALGHAMLWNTPESKYEHLPLVKDGYVLTMDARIDNREELAREIELPDRPMEEIGDSEFILGAYKKWGEECPKHLLGDFAFAIWDETKKQLFCVKDHVGIKQLYYYVIDLLFVFSNDLKGLMEHSNIPKIIDDEAVADYFINSELTSQYLTFFKNVRKLPSAHSLTVSINEIKKKCYWRLEDAPKFNDENIEIYAKKLRILLEEAVHVRMRTIYPTTSHLSGGLDSSSIAVIAARKLRAKNERLTAFNWLHKPIKNSDTNHYEWSNSKTISELENIDFNYISLSSKEIYGYCINESIAYGNTAPFFFAEYPIREAAKNNGSRTIFSGWGGDELASQHANSYYADLFLQGKIKKLFKELKVLVNKRNNKIKGFLGTIYYQILLPQIPKWLYCKMPRSKCFIPFFPFVKNDFLIKIKSIMKNFPIDERLAHKTLKEHSLLLWADGYLQSRIESWSVAGTANRIEYVYPLLDKRIVEFILGVPTECFVDSGMKRYLFRSAVKDLLPKKILLESTKDEINRVEHLYLLLFDASKMFLGNDKIINNKSKYINNEKLKNTLSSMQKLSVKDDVLDEIMVSFQILVMLKELENECQSQEIQ